MTLAKTVRSCPLSLGRLSRGQVHRTKVSGKCTWALKSGWSTTLSKQPLSIMARCPSLLSLLREKFAPVSLKLHSLDLVFTNIASFLEFFLVMLVVPEGRADLGRCPSRSLHSEDMD
jgi:hypothetical protein